MLKSINPYNNETVAQYEEWNDAQVKEAIERSHKAFKQWKNVSLQERLKIMDRLAKLIDERKHELAKLATLEMGKLLRASEDEVMKCSRGCRFYAENAERFLEDKPAQTEAARSFVRYQPLGPILAIMPWNFPFWQVFRFAAPALMASLSAGESCFSFPTTSSDCSSFVER